MFEDDFEDVEPTPFESRLHKIAEDAIPTSIDRTDDGEFVMRSYYPELSRTEYGAPVVNGKILPPAKLDEDGNVIIGRNAKKELAYFFNEDLMLCFRTIDDKIQAYFYSDDDNEYHFDVNVNENMLYTKTPIGRIQVPEWEEKNSSHLQTNNYCKKLVMKTNTFVSAPPLLR